MLLNRAVPGAPGTPAFRSALRDALESTKNFSDINGQVNTTPNDHIGLDQRARVMVEICDGKWIYQPR